MNAAGRFPGQSFASLRLASAALWLALASLPAAAQVMDANRGIYGQTGLTTHSTRSSSATTIGLVTPAQWHTDWWNGKLSSYGDVFLSDWRAPAIGGGTSSYRQIGVMPVLRYRPNDGGSAWFVDAGLGLSYLDRIYATPDRTFSTRLNFFESFRLGRTIGAQGRYELAVQLQHFSNAGIREPNPGETFIQLRFAARF